MRALALYAAFQLDLAQHDADEATRAKAQARADLLIPIVKGWCTEHGNEVTHIGIQTHGGMGFIEETGAAQYARDVRITTIYEGTTGIQANDLIGRKIGRDGGAALGALLADVMRELNGLQVSNPLAQATKTAALEGVGLLERSRSVAREGAAVGAGSGAGRCRSVPEAVRLRARRLADGEGRQHRGREAQWCGQGVLRGEAAHARASTPTRCCR